MTGRWRKQDSARADAARGAVGRANPKARRPLGQSGVTFVEILVATVLMSIVIVPTFNALVSGRMFTSHRGEERMALGLVERKLEQLMNAGYGALGSDTDVSSVNLAPGTHPNDPTIVVNTRGNDDASDDVLGELTWTVHDLAWDSPGDSARAKAVEVQLRWPAGSPRDSVAVTTLVGA